ncbi:TetR/AcrR family transcriptional regulator [Faecalispora jeddahensis]|uniref:TetR/AcrR family transcriptional regulator n=1 Tax=Faecalispora jeddahensis TaxID=1414721 RepID=UPI0018989EB0|nr:TetR/AcrR family transcriptional regulator [Faecalispora jeddahensis]
MENQKSYHHKNLRNELIEKGIRLVNEEGLKAFSLRKAAAACGVSHAAPYSHFQNKEELLEAMQNYITDEFSAILEDTISEYGNRSDVLEQLGKAYVVFFLKNPHYFSFLYTQSNMKIDLSFRQDKDRNYKPFEIFMDLALKRMDQADYPEEKRKDAVIALWSFVHGIASLATMKNVSYDEDWENKITDFMSVFHCSFLKENQNGGQ